MLPVIDGPTFGQQLQALRRQNGLTQDALAAALAQRSGPAASLIDDWHAWIAAVEQGQIPTVDHLVIVAFALTLHVPVSALLPPPAFDEPLPTVRDQLQAQGLLPEQIQALGHSVDLDERSACVVCTADDLAQ